MASGTFYLSSSSADSSYHNKIQGWLSWSATTDATNNRSYVKVKSLEVHKYGADGYSTVNTWGTWYYSISINGSVAGSGTWYGKIGSGWQTLASDVGAYVNHNTDGNKNVKIYAYIEAPSGTSMAGKYTSGSSTVKLDTIPRVSGISAPNGDIESTITIAIDKKATTHTNTVSYKVSGESSFTTIASQSSATAINWTIPMSAYDQMGETSREVAITLQTETFNSDGTSIGTATADIKAFATATRCTPTMSCDVELESSASGLFTTDTAVVNWSRSFASCSFCAQRGAKIVKAIITCGTDVSVGSFNSMAGAYMKTVDPILNNVFYFSVEDSRGYTTEGSVDLSSNSVAWFVPSVSITGEPPNPSTNVASITVKGKSYIGGFPLGTPTQTLSVYYKESSASSWTLGDTYTITPTTQNWQHTFSLTLDYQKQWQFKGYISDGLTWVYSDVLTLKTLPIFDWDKDDFNFNVPVAITGDLDVNGDVNITGDLTFSNAQAIYNMIYPVGSIYMSINSANPSTLFGGTWVQLKETFLFGASQIGSSSPTYTVDSSKTTAQAGEATHQLTVNEMPKHSHYTTANLSKYTGEGEIAWYDGSSFELVSPYTDSAGGDAAHNNMPPYLVVYMWKRTA